VHGRARHVKGRGMHSEKGHIEFRVQVIIEPDGNEFHAYCPALKGLHTCGNTEEEALRNARDAAVAYLHSLIQHGDPIPIGVMGQKRVKKTPSPPESHHIERVAVVA